MSRKSIIKNTAFMTTASIGQKVVAFAYFTLIARMLGAGDTGKYFLAISFSTMFVIFVDLGFTSVLVREGAKFKEKIQDYFSTVITIKILFGILSYFGLIIAVNFLDYSQELKGMVYLSGVTMLFDSLHLTIYGVLRSIGDLKYEAISIFLSQAITLLLGSIFLFFKFPLYFLILAFTIPSFLNVCFSSTILYKKYKVKLIPKFDKQTFFHLGKIAIPFALAGIFARIYSYTDSIIMSKVAGEVVVGWYSVPYKMIHSFQFIPLALVATLYPRFSEYYKNNPEKLQYIFQQGIKYLLIIVFPISFGIFVLAEDIILNIYTVEYINSILPLKILILSLIFSYLSYPIGALLNACNRQKTQTIIVGVVLLVNVGVNLVLIPRFGAVGASITVLLSNLLLAGLGYLTVPKISKISHVFFLNIIVRLLVSVGVMVTAVSYVNSLTNFGIAILVGALVYPIMIFATGVVTKKQLTEALNLIRH